MAQARRPPAGHRRRPGDAGDRCRSEGYADYPSRQCKPGLACASFRCTPVLEADAACGPRGLPCETGLFCDWRTQTCLALPGPGEACEDGSLKCESGYCNEGVCLDFSAIGLPCDELHPCHSGVCTDGFCVDDENCEGVP